MKRKCGDCDARLPAHGLYRNSAGAPICVVCFLVRDTEVAAIVTATLASFRRNR